MIDMMKPAGWKAVPGSGFENKRPIKPPIIDPAIPRSADFQKPRCWRPGTRNSAMPPTIAPTTIDQMMCSISLFVSVAQAITPVCRKAILFLARSTLTAAHADD